jgi:hypothetical protein
MVWALVSPELAEPKDNRLSRCRGARAIQPLFSDADRDNKYVAGVEADIREKPPPIFRTSAYVGLSMNPGRGPFENI